MFIHGVGKVFRVLLITNHFYAKNIRDQTNRTQYGAHVNLDYILKPFEHEFKAVIAV